MKGDLRIGRKKKLRWRQEGTQGIAIATCFSAIACRNSGQIKAHWVFIKRQGFTWKRYRTEDSIF